MGSTPLRGGIILVKNLEFLKFLLSCSAKTSEQVSRCASNLLSLWSNVGGGGYTPLTHSNSSNLAQKLKPHCPR